MSSVALLFLLLKQFLSPPLMAVRYSAWTYPSGHHL
jgi:hypothetical protein